VFRQRRAEPSLDDDRVGHNIMDLQRVKVVMGGAQETPPPVAVKWLSKHDRHGGPKSIWSDICCLHQYLSSSFSIKQPDMSIIDNIY